MKENPPTLAISKEAVAELPVVTFEGDITVVDDMATARAALRDIKRAGTVGFDTETRPSFKRGIAHKVALMQISTADRCYLFRLNKLGLFEGLRQMLEDPEVHKIGLSVHDDFNVLRRSAPVEPQGFLDLQVYVKAFGITDLSLQKIYAILFGKRISKNQRLTNWEAETLTDGQQHYASMDAWACLRIYNYLRAGKFNPMDSPYRVEPDADAPCGTPAAGPGK